MKKTEPSLECFEFKCSCCGEIHKGIPSFGIEAPNYLYSIPKEERRNRATLTTDTCIIDNEHFFVRCCLELPVIGYKDIFSFGCWVSLSSEHFTLFEQVYNDEIRDYHEPMFAWFSSWIWPFYEGAENIKSRIHLRNHGNRPFVELEPIDHPLAIAQYEGVEPSEIIRINEHYVHGKK